jgi:hypothetical protein
MGAASAAMMLSSGECWMKGRKIIMRYNGLHSAKRPIAKLLFAAAALQASFAISYANQLTNGSFETPVIPPATFLDFGVGGEPAGFAWTVSTNPVDIVSNGFLGGTAFDGVQWLDLVGFGSTGGIEQSFTTTPNQAYTLSFAYANNPGPGVPVPTSADVSVTNGAATLLDQSISHGTSVVSNLNWTTFSMMFTANGASARLAFDETVGGANGGVFLDAVSIRPAVPEPSTWAMMLVGFSILGYAANRRRRTAKIATSR